MNKLNLTLLLLLPFLLNACVSKRSELATKIGYAKSTKVQAGPYELHYGKNASGEFLLLAEGDWNILSREGGSQTDVYFRGLPFISFDRNQD